MEKVGLAKNVVVVAAMGNAGHAGNPISYPAAYPGVVGVGAVTRSLSKPLDGLYQILEDQAAGDFSRRLRVDTRGAITRAAARRPRDRSRSVEESRNHGRPNHPT